MTAEDNPHPHDIKNVSDTALWVAAYRAEESERKDAFFRDPYARILVGDSGTKLATRTQGSRFTAWSVVIRTIIIDSFITSLSAEADIVLNLGAGLDTRPYRLKLKPDIIWHEVDFPEIINLKKERLKNIRPNVELHQHSFDLLDKEVRNNFFRSINDKNKRVLILTEGVMPYLANIEVQQFARDLHSYATFRYWINEYYSPEILQFLNTPKRQKQMRYAPFLFCPANWIEFYIDCGWKHLETRYFGPESERLGRTPPEPGWIKESGADVRRYLGYSLYKR